MKRGSPPWFQTRIKRLRAKTGMTQEQFAHRLGVTFVTVNRWERGHSYPTGLSVAVLEGLEKETMS